MAGWPRIGFAFVFVILMSGAVEVAHATEVPCGNTWFRRGVENTLAADWNTPLPTVGQEETLPAAAAETGASPTLSLSQASLDDSFQGFLGVTVGNLVSGQRLILERYRVTSAAAGIDANAILQGRHVLQDGFQPRVGGVRNLNIPNDESSTPGEIVIQLDYFEPSVANIAGDYVFRILSPTGAYTPVDAGLRVNAGTAPQKFTGTVTSGGMPVPHVFVLALEPLGQNNDIVKGVSADAAGDYELFIDSPEEYDLVAVAPGFVGAYGDNTGRVIAQDETIQADLALTPADRTLSGTLVDAADPSVRLGGVELLLFSIDSDDRIDGNLFTVAWTDANGAFSAGVTAGRWGIVPRTQAIYDRGYIGPGERVRTAIDASTGGSGGHEITLIRGTSLIHGFLHSSRPSAGGDPVPLVGVEVRAHRASDGRVAYGITYDDGSYRIAVAEGYWNVFAFTYSLEDSGHSGPFPSDIKVGSGVQAVRYDFTARPQEAELAGFVTDHNGDPIRELELRAVQMQGSTPELPFSNTYESDGFYQFFLGSGTWALFPEPIEAARQQLLFKDLPVQVIAPLAMGQSQPRFNRDITTVAHTSSINLTISHATQAVGAGVRVHASASIGGSVYHVFGLTDTTGVARIPVIDGTWNLHVSDRNLTELGFLEEAAFDVVVSGGDANHTVNTTLRQNSQPSLSVVKQSGAFHSFGGQGEAGWRYVVEGSEDLTVWRELGRVVAEDGSFTVTDQSTTPATARFLRARTP